MRVRGSVLSQYGAIVGVLTKGAINQDVIPLGQREGVIERMARELRQVDRAEDTVDFDHIRSL